MSDFGIIESDERRICYREETRHGGRRYTIQLFNLESSTSIVAIGPTSTYTLDVCGKKKDSSGRSLLIEEESRCFLEGLFWYDDSSESRPTNPKMNIMNYRSTHNPIM